MHGIILGVLLCVFSWSPCLFSSEYVLENKTGYIDVIKLSGKAKTSKAIIKIRPGNNLKSEEAVGTIDYRRKFESPYQEPYGDGKMWMTTHVILDEGMAYVIDNKHEIVTDIIEFEKIKKGEKFSKSEILKDKGYFKIEDMKKKWADYKKIQDGEMIRLKDENERKKRLVMSNAASSYSSDATLSKKTEETQSTPRDSTRDTMKRGKLKRKLF